METNKDLILRNIKYFAEFLMALTKQKPVETLEIDTHINEFVLKHFNITFKSILEKKPEDIVKIIKGDNYFENIKDFADILFMKHSTESDYLEKIELSKKIIELYKIYQSRSNIYSLEVQSRIKELCLI